MLRAASAVVVAVLAVGSAGAVDVTQCGQYIPPRETGILQNDLLCGATPQGFCADCDQPSCFFYVDMPCTVPTDCHTPNGVHICAGVGVLVGNRATLDLNGFSVAVNQPAVPVQCEGTCELRGPGEVRGGLYWAVGGRRVQASSLTVRDAYKGINAFFLKLDGVVVTGNQAGAEAFRLTAVNSAFTNNATYYGARARSIRGQGITASGNGLGLSAQIIRVVGVTANGNTLDGVNGTRVVLDGGTITGNGRADVASFIGPRLNDVTCGSSANLDAGGTWGVCSGD